MKPLRNYQVIGIKQMISARRFLLCDEPGVAKTRQLMEAAERVGNPEYPILVVVGLKVTIGAWQDQIETWSPESTYVVYTGQPHLRKKIAEKIKKGGFRYVITNIALFKELYPKHYWSAVIFDEYHKMGLCNRKSKTYETVHHNINNPKFRAPVVYMATGTPISKDPSDLWGPLHLLYPSRFRGFWNFVNDHCIVREDFHGYKHIERQPKNPKLLQAQLSGIFLRRKLLQVAPEIKEPIRSYIPITMEEPLRGMYKELAEQLLLELGEEFIITPNKIANLIRLRQLLVSPQVLADHSEENPVPIGQIIPMAIDLMAEEVEQDKPVVIFTPFRKGVEIIEREVYSYFNKRREACEIYTVLGGGDQGAASVAQDFQRSTHRKRVLIGTIASAASYTATSADLAIFVGGDYSSVNMDQAERRILRLGQSRPARFFYLYHRGTVEAKLFRTVRDKNYWADVTLTMRDLLPEE